MKWVCVINGPWFDRDGRMFPGPNRNEVVTSTGDKGGSYLLLAEYPIQDPVTGDVLGHHRNGFRPAIDLELDEEVIEQEELVLVEH